MKKEEFLAKLRKNLSILEEKEIQDIVEEYEQHIDMKMKGGLSEEAAIQDFGDLKELTAGILEAYHVKADYQAEKKNLDFDKVKEESRKATEKATTAIGKGAGMIGKGAGAAGKWGVRQIHKMFKLIQRPFLHLKETLKQSKEKAEGRGLFGRLWLMFLGLCNVTWKGCKWFLYVCWNAFWLFSGIMMTMATLFCIFSLGMTVVLLSEGYPLTGVLLAVIGCGLISAAISLLCFSLMTRNRVESKNVEKNQQQTPPDEHMDKGLENNWEYPEGKETSSKQIVINEYQEVLHHA